MNKIYIVLVLFLISLNVNSHPYLLKNYHFDKNSNISNNDQANFDIIKKTDFENNTVGKYSNVDYKRNFSQPRNLRSDNSTLVQVVDGKKYLTHFYEKDKFGTATGMNEWGLLDESLKLEEIYFSFKFKMSEDFDFGIVAKFFGFVAGGVSTFPPHGTLGANMGPYGSYVRLYWREDGSFEFNSKHHGMCATCTNVKLGYGRFGKITPGKWQTYTMRVVMNTVGKANGIVQVWIDDQLVASVSDIVWRTQTSPQYFGEMMLDSFMGGDDSRFAPSKTQYMWQDNIHIWKYNSSYLSSNPSIKRGLQLWSQDEKLITPINVQNSVVSNPTFNLNINATPSEGGQVKIKVNN